MILISCTVDINAMMMECSDLTAPNKAKTFQKHSLKQLHPSHHTVKQHESNQARQWKQMNLDDLGDIFVVEGWLNLFELFLHKKGIAAHNVKVENSFFIFLFLKIEHKM